MESCEFVHPAVFWCCVDRTRFQKAGDPSLVETYPSLVFAILAICQTNISLVIILGNFR